MWLLKLTLCTTVGCNPVNTDGLAYASGRDCSDGAFTIIETFRLDDTLKVRSFNFRCTERAP